MIRIAQRRERQEQILGSGNYIPKTITLGDDCLTERTSSMLDKIAPATIYKN